jgi:hypothetical protein
MDKYDGKWRREKRKKKKKKSIVIKRPSRALSLAGQHLCV